MKKVRVNEKYGVWTWSTPYYHEILEFIKADDKTKQTYLNYY